MEIQPTVVQPYYGSWSVYQLDGVWHWTASGRGMTTGTAATKDEARRQAQAEHRRLTS